MAVDLCIEATAGLLHALEMAWIDVLLPGRNFTVNDDRNVVDSTVDVHGLTSALPDAEFDQSVLRGVDILAFDEAQVLWLVDCCGLSYGETAGELGLPYDEVANLVREARQHVCAQVRADRGAV